MATILNARDLSIEADAVRITTSTGYNTVTAKDLAITIGGGNLLRNSSFETDSDSNGLADKWLTYNAGVVGTVTYSRLSGGIAGGQYQRLNASGLGTTTADSVGIYGVVELAQLVGNPFVFSSWVVGLGGGTGSINIRLWINFYSSPGGVGAPISSLNKIFTTPTVGWQRLNLTGVIPAGTVSAKCYVWMESRGGAAGAANLDIDAVQFEIGDVMTAYAPSAADAATTLQLQSTGFAFVFTDATDTTGNTPTDITFTAVLQNISGTVAFTATAYDYNGVSLGNPTLTSQTATTAVLTAANFNSLGLTTVRTVVVTATLGALSDQMTIYRGDGGSSAIQAALSNEAHTIPTASDGSAGDYTGSGTTIRVFEGITELAYNPAWTTENGQWKVVATPTNITTVGAITTSGLFATVAPHSGMTANTASVSFAITGKSVTGASFSFTKIQTLSKSRAGTPGVDGGNITVQSNAGQAFTLSAPGTGYTPTSITLSRVLGPSVNDLVAAGTVWSVINGTFTGSLAITNTATGAFAAIDPSKMTTGTVTFRCTVTDTVNGHQYSDDVTIFKSRDPISGYLTNDSISLPAAEGGGMVSSYTGATGTFKVTGAQGDITVLGGNPAFSYMSQTGFTTAPTASINTSGVYTISSGIDPSTAVKVATVTYRATFTDPLGGSTRTIDRTFTLSKAAQGVQGLQGLQGNPGTTGSGARTAYALFTISTYTNVAWDAGATLTVSGDTLPGGTTVSNPDASTAWTSTTQSPAAGQGLYRAVGAYNPATNQTVWQSPVLDNFRVGSLSAISADIGTITAGDLTAAKFRSAASGARVTINDTGTPNKITGYTPGGLQMFTLDAASGIVTMVSDQVSTTSGALRVDTSAYTGASISALGPAGVPAINATATSTGTGVQGTAGTSGVGVQGNSSSGSGVYGVSTTGPGVRASSLRIDQTPATGAAVASFSGVKPGGATTNTWFTINLNGTTYYIPCWT